MLKMWHFDELLFHRELPKSAMRVVCANHINVQTHVYYLRILHRAFILRVINFTNLEPSIK